MRLELYRYSSQKDSTLGIMFLVDKENHKEFLCYTLEDEYRQSKIYGETRIPAKQYYVELRKEGGYNEKYKKDLPKFMKVCYTLLMFLTLIGFLFTVAIMMIIQMVAYWLEILHNKIYQKKVL